MLNAEAAVLEAAFPARHFGLWRSTAYQNQVQFITDAAQTFSGIVAPGLPGNSSVQIPANALLASLQISWGGLLSPNNLNLAVFDPQNVKQAEANAINLPGLTGRRQRISLALPSSGNWKAQIKNTLGVAGTPQSYTGVVQVSRAEYAPMNDISDLSSMAVSEIYQSFRSLVMSPIGRNFRPGFAVTRADLATAMVVGGRVPQYLPAQSNYADIRDRTTMLFVESVQAAPAGSLFPNAVAGGTFQPGAVVDRLTAAIALVRAAGLRTQAELGSYPLAFADATAIPSSLRGYVALAVQNGLIKSNGVTFNPQGSFTRADLAHAMTQLASLATH